jgi:hypothetical protein
MNSNTPMSDADTETREVHIYLNNDTDVRQWIEKFGCSREDLVFALNKIGTSAGKVEAYLKRRQVAGFSKW